MSAQRSSRFTSSVSTSSFFTSSIVAVSAFSFALLLIFGCGDDADAPLPQGDARTVPPEDAFEIEEVARFDRGWAMRFLPDGRLLVTEKAGALKLLDLESAQTIDIAGVPAVVNQGQGGLGDVIHHPDFEDNGLIYLSYVEAGEGGTGAVVIRARLELGANAGSLTGIERIWEQRPKINTDGHFSHRLLFDSEKKLFITSGDRQRLQTAQERDNNLGKIIRLNDDGSIPSDNPFYSEGGIAREFWTLGHRNALGIALDARGRIISSEMGPQGGDELNLIEPGNNYGWPRVSEGEHYDGSPIPDHSTDPEYRAPMTSWVPAISPGSLEIYSGALSEELRGNAFLGGLSSQALIRVAISGDEAKEVERYPMNTRVREVKEGPDGALYLLEDGGTGRLLRLRPR